jgi:hypothetical protein
MTRAYIRLDPGFIDHKASYPDGAYAALIDCFCFGETQLERGYFRDARVLRALLGKRGKWLKYLLDHDDLLVLPDGRLYIDGWKEWQEGDWKVGERVHRIRGRRNGKATEAVTPDVTPDVTVDVTVPVQPNGALDLSLIGVGGGVIDSAGGGAGDSAVGAGNTTSPPDATDSDDDHLDAWYRLTGSWPTKKVLPWLNELADAHGSAAVCEALAGEWTVSSDRSTLLSRTQDRLRRDAHEAEKAAEARRKREEAEERARIEAMPEEQRAANLDRLRDMMAEKGLLPAAAKRGGKPERVGRILARGDA